MIVAFSTKGNGWHEKLDGRFGRAAGFFIFNTEDNHVKYIDNGANIDAAHGAGTSAAKTILDEKTDVLITGKVGPKAEAVLRTGTLKIYNFNGDESLETVYKKFQNDELPIQG